MVMGIFHFLVFKVRLGPGLSVLVELTLYFFDLVSDSSFGVKSL